MTEIDWSKHKYCSSCKTVHPLTHFYKNRNASSNYMKHCKTCVNTNRTRASDKPYQPRQGLYLNPTTRLKKCRQCGQELSSDHFYANNTTADRLSGKCKVCLNVTKPRKNDKPYQPRQAPSEKKTDAGKQNTARLEYRLDDRTGMKKCKNCGVTFLASNFYRDPHTADRLASNCKTCHKEKYHVKYVPRPKKSKPEPTIYEPTDLKECKECETPLPRTEFFKEARNKDGLNTRCKTCFNKRYHHKETMKKQIHDPSSPVKTCNTCGGTKDKTEFYSAPSNADGLMHRCKSCHKEHLISKKVSKAKDATNDAPFTIKTNGSKSYRGWLYLLVNKAHPERIYLYPSKQDASTLLAYLNELTPDGNGWSIITSRESNSTENLCNTLSHYLLQEFPTPYGFGFSVPNTHLTKSRFLESFNHYADCYTATVNKQPLPTRDNTFDMDNP